MSFDLDCARKLMISFEAHEVVDEHGCLLSSFSLKPVLNDLRADGYPDSVIYYTFRMLVGEGLISCRISCTKSQFAVYFGPEDGLTPSGHRFLSSIRDNTVWAKVKERLLKVGGSASLGIIGAIGETITKSILLGG